MLVAQMLLQFTWCNRTCGCWRYIILHLIDDENAILISNVLEFCQGHKGVALEGFNLPSLQWSAGDEMFAGACQRDRLFLYCFVAADLMQ